MGLKAFISAFTGGNSVDLYARRQPALVIEEFFNGPMKAWGIVQDRGGKVKRSFSIDMVGEWSGDTGTLTEDFDYYDGETDQRIWTIKKIDDHHYEGTAWDVDGKATGRVSGNAVNWSYVMKLKINGKTYHIPFDDWMFLMKEDVLINRVYMKKFGIKVAEITLFMQKQAA